MSKPNMIDAAAWRVFRTDHGWHWSANVGLAHAHGYAGSRELAIARAEQACDLLVAQDKTDA